MKITYHGGSAVDIAGHDNVQPGDTVDVPDEQGTALLFAGSQVLDDGSVVAPTAPLWTVPTKAAAAAKES